VLTVLLASMLVLSAAPATAASSSKIEADVVKQTNAERSKRDLKKLKTSSSCVERHAESHARRQARQQRMFHQDIEVVLRTCHLTQVGENVATGYTSGKSVTGDWMKSPGHRRNIMTKSYRYIGVGSATGSDGRWYRAQVFGTR
jgi:uncharacterized protein YkwD